MTYAVRGIVHGKVQGVGYRFHVKQSTESTLVSGYALNLPDRTVEVLLVGEQNEVLRVQKAAEAGPRFSRVDNIDWKIVDGQAVEEVVAQGFRIG